ncbi:MAG: ComF family protein [Phycisphaerales bacterium]|nr:ComF family protein [Phycisphaerales bacterium]
MPTDLGHRDPIPKRDPALDGFVWPPRDEASGHPTTTITHPQQGSNRLSAMIESVELDLLGRTGLAFDRWSQRTNWTPDPREVTCWRCAGSVGPHEQDGEGCAACRSKSLPWDRALRLARYGNELRDEILALKFNTWRPGGRALGRILGERIRSELGYAQIPSEQACLVPVPMHPFRRISRGIDHTLTLARWASKTSGCPVHGVLRAHYRPEQVGLSASARARNMKGAFGCRSRAMSRVCGSGGHGVRVWILIDDVRTTGATFVAASRVLRSGLGSLGFKKGEHEIWVCSVAVASERLRRELA